MTGIVTGKRIGKPSKSRILDDLGEIAKLLYGQIMISGDLHPEHEIIIIYSPRPSPENFVFF